MITARSEVESYIYDLTISNDSDYTIKAIIKFIDHVDSLTIAPDKNGRLLGIPIQSSHNIDLISSTFRCEVTGYNNLDTLETKLFNNIYSLDKDYEKTCTQEYHSYHLSINNNNIK